MTRLSLGDEDLHDPTDPTLHRWEPPGIPDPQGDAAWLARLTAHVNTHRAREMVPVPTDCELENGRR